MNTHQDLPTENLPLATAQRVFQVQKRAYAQCQNPDYKARKHHLEQLERLLLENMDDIAEATNKDYGNRSKHEAMLAEIFATVDGIRYAKKKLSKWVKPQHRSTSIWFFGAKNSVQPQPKGVIGVISPWNYPLFLFASPVTSALAAGNRCMIKMAAQASHLAKLMHRLIDKYFDEEVLAVIPNISGSDFTTLPYDHLVFTGSANTARHVMAAAAKHLTPVTLELGGKSPVIIDKDFDLALAAKRIMYFKAFNAGQTCVAPDFALVHKSQVDDLLKQLKSITQERFQSVHDRNLTSIISDAALARLQGYLSETEAQGAKVHNLLGDGQAMVDAADHKLAPLAVVGARDDSQIMQEEIFGPILPIKTYDDLDEAIDYVNSRPNPLALYLFSNNKKVQHKVNNNTLSGALGINDCALQVAQHDIPFGGIGESGMGQYHSKEGFMEFSKMKPIFKQTRFASIQLLYPPYGKIFNLVLKLMLK